jgi:hypothetical protein
VCSKGTSPLSSLAQDALDTLASVVPNDGELTYGDAYEVRAQEDNLQQPAAADIIERLHMRGYLYEIEGGFRLTDS